jgi:glutathione S-transferase
MALTLLGGGVSPFVRKVRVVLAEKGLDYQHENVNPFSPPEGWRNVSPLGRIPALKDGDKIINDSSVICAYLERRFPKPALYPTDDYEYARALWFEEFADGGMIPVMGPKTFFPLVLKPLFGGKSEPDPADVEAAEKTVAEECPKFWDYLERELGDGEYFVGGRLTIADISVASGFVNLRHAGFAPERKRWPKLRAFIDRMHGRPSFKPLIEQESPVFGKRAALVRD